jgi:hypothetical protein
VGASVLVAAAIAGFFVRFWQQTWPQPTGWMRRPALAPRALNVTPCGTGALKRHERTLQGI